MVASSGSFKKSSMSRNPVLHEYSSANCATATSTISVTHYSQMLVPSFLKSFAGCFSFEIITERQLLLFSNTSMTQEGYLEGHFSSRAFSICLEQISQSATLERVKCNLESIIPKGQSRS